MIFDKKIIECIEKNCIEALDIFRELLGKQKINRDCTIKYGDKNDPFYHVETKTIHLLTDKEKCYYMQIINQIAHELVHHIISEKLNIEKYDYIEHKEEEVLCSAYSLYVICLLKWTDYLSDSLVDLFLNHKYKKWAPEILETYNDLVRNFDKTFNDRLNLIIKNRKQ